MNITITEHKTININEQQCKEIAINYLRSLLPKYSYVERNVFYQSHDVHGNLPISLKVKDVDDYDRKILDVLELIK